MFKTFREGDVLKRKPYVPGPVRDFTFFRIVASSLFRREIARPVETPRVPAGGRDERNLSFSGRKQTDDN